MGRDIDFGDDVDELAFGQYLQVDELLFRIGAVLCRQSRIGVTLQSESRVGFHQIPVIKPWKGIVIQVYLESVHLVVGHDPDVILKKL